MPRRQQVHMACQRCRKKRAKCDGQDPCERCQVGGHDCVFDRSRRESKNDLRAELERLRRANVLSGALLDAMSSTEDAASYHAVAKGLMDGTTTREDIFLGLPSKFKDKSACIGSSLPYRPQATISTGASISASASASQCPRATCTHCRGALPLPTASLGDGDGGSADWSSDWGPSVDTQSDGDNAVTSPVSVLSSLASVPSLASSGAGVTVEQNESRAPVPRIDSWTRTGWTADLVLEHIELLVTWDYLPFCLLCKDLFLQDLHKGTGRYCSSALVYALLALAKRIMNEQQQQQQRGRRGSSLAANIGVVSPAPPSSTAPAKDWTDSQAFWNEAEALIRGSGQHSNSLPDIQALGIMALYLVSSGRQAEARELADEFAAAATDLCLRAPAAEEHQEEYARVRATTYCGAISLVRILKLTTAQPSGLHAAMLQDDGVTLDKPSHIGGSHDNRAPLGNFSRRCNRQYGATVELEAWWHTDSLTTPNPGSVADVQPRLQLRDLQIIPAKVFQLTEWLYKLLASQGCASGEHVASVYRQCLDWYERLFSLFRSEGSKTPFILFIHIYYQFCLLSLFRPFYGANLEAFNICPREICVQAAHSILVLTQSYASLYGLWRAPPLVPFFVYASGLLSIAAEDAGRSMPEVVPVATFANHDDRLAASLLPVGSFEATVIPNSCGDSMGVENGHGLKSSPNPERQRGQPELPSSAHVNMPAITHARLLLEEMSSLHPVAADVEGMLQRTSGMN